jgi:hypothetical protein
MSYLKFGLKSLMLKNACSFVLAAINSIVLTWEHLFAKYLCSPNFNSFVSLQYGNSYVFLFCLHDWCNWRILGIAPGIPPSTGHSATYMLPNLCIQSSQLLPPQLADGNSVGNCMVGTFCNLHRQGDWMPTPMNVKSKVPVSKLEPSCSRLNSDSGNMAAIFIPALFVLLSCSYWN